jgi:hypothetical protein
LGEVLKDVGRMDQTRPCALVRPLCSPPAKLVYQNERILGDEREDTG